MARQNPTLARQLNCRVSKVLNAGNQGKHPWDQNPRHKENEKTVCHSACELSTKKRSSAQDQQAASLNPVLMSQSAPDAQPLLMSRSVTTGAWGSASSKGRTKAKPNRQEGPANHTLTVLQWNEKSFLQCAAIMEYLWPLLYYYILVLNPSWWVCEISMIFFSRCIYFKN